MPQSKSISVCKAYPWSHYYIWLMRFSKLYLRMLPSNLWYLAHQIPKLKFFSSRLVLPLSQSIKAMRSVDNEDVVGAAPTGDAPTTSEWSAMLLPHEVRLILENWRYIPFTQVYHRITGFSSGHPELPLLTVRMLQFLRHTKLTGKRSKHDDVIKRKNILRYWPFVRGIHGSSSNSPHKGQWRGALMFTLVCAGTNGWINNRDAGDLRRNSAHYDVTVV